VKLDDPTGWSKEVPLKLVPKRRGDKDTTIKVNSQVKLDDPTGWSKEVPLKLVPKRRGDKDTTIKVNSQVKLDDPTGWSKEVPLKLVPKRRGDKDTTIKVNSQVKLADPNVPLYLLLNTVDKNDYSSDVVNPLYFADVVDVDETESKMIKSTRSISVNTYLDTLSRNELKHVSTPVTNYIDSLSICSNQKFASQPFEEFDDVKIDTVELSSEAANFDAGENDISGTNKVLDVDMQNILSSTELVYQFITGIENRFNILHGAREFLQNSLVNVSFEVKKKTENALSFVTLKLSEISDEFDLPRTSITIVAAVGELIENTMKKVTE
jgi:hypothetical protein